MKITLYTINDCQYSKQEKEYLNANNLSYEEKNLESNREFLTEMQTVSNNFAGTPVTKIEKDDGQIVVLKGFTKEEFDTALGLEQKTPVPPVSTPTADLPTAPILSTPEPISQPVPEPLQPLAPPEPVPPPLTPAPTTPDPLNSVLNNLQQKADAPTT